MLLLNKKPKFSINLGLAVGLALSIAVGLSSYFVTKKIIDRDNEARFRSMAHAAQYTIDARIKSYTNMVRASASLFDATEDVTREEFHQFVKSLQIQEHYPAIETVNYIHALRDDERDAFEAKIQRETALANDGRPNFQIKPPGRRPTYSVVLYIEPNPGWMHVTGLDLDANPLTRKAMADSRDSGILATSGAPIKAMTARHRIGFGMRLPLYRPGAPIDSVEERRAAYRGSVGIAFNVERLVQGVLGELPVKAVRLSLFNQILKVDPATPQLPQLIYDSSATGTSRPQALADPADDLIFHVVLPVDFNGRVWTAHFSVPKNQLYRSSDTSFPLLAFLAGTTTTLLLYGGFHTLTTSRRRAVELANGMTKELRESEEQLLQSHQRLRQLAAHLENVKESERKRIAREIHDDLGQNLLALRIDAELLLARTRAHHSHLHKRAQATLGHIDTTIKSVRSIINDLRPNVLDLGLNAAAAWQMDQFRQRSGIVCELVEPTADIKVSDQCATGLFRILQESLSNVTRHSGATAVRVELYVEGDWVRMLVRDNGIGLLPTGRHKRGAFGLIGIEERVRILGGSISIVGTPGVGTTVNVAVPAHEAIQDIAEAADQTARANAAAAVD